MNKKAIVMSIMALVVLGSLAMYAAAYRGDPSIQGPNHDEETHALIEQAIEEGDYSTWQELMSEYSRGRILEIVTEENFDEFAQMHQLMEAGDLEGAAQVRAELGLNNEMGPHDGTGHGAEKGMRGQGTGMRIEGRGQGMSGAGLRDGSCLAE